MIPLFIQGLFSVFFLLLEFFCKGAQTFISLSTLLITSSDYKSILLSSKQSSVCQSTFSSCSDIPILFLHFPVVQILQFCFYIFQLFRYCNFVSTFSSCLDIAILFLHFPVVHILQFCFYIFQLFRYCNFVSSYFLKLRCKEV